MNPLCPPVVDASFLEQQPHTVLADVRWYLDGRDGRTAYEAGHLPGAIWIDLERDLADPAQAATEGRHPLPQPAAFARAMAAHGISNESVVVAYDDTGGVTAGRLVVMLRMLGVRAAVLDGGLAGWEGPLQTGPGAPPQPASFTPIDWPHQHLADADAVTACAAAGGVLLDARSPDRFSGEQAMIDPRPGHIPGARNAPWASVLTDDGHFKIPTELAAYFAGLGIDASTPAHTAIAYCGSGVSACLNLLALEHAGLAPARLYVASWSGWSADEQRPTELGNGGSARA